MDATTRCSSPTCRHHLVITMPTGAFAAGLHDAALTRAGWTPDPDTQDDKHWLCPRCQP